MGCGCGARKFGAQAQTTTVQGFIESATWYVSPDGVAFDADNPLVFDGADRVLWVGVLKRPIRATTATSVWSQLPGNKRGDAVAFLAPPSVISSLRSSYALEVKDPGSVAYPEGYTP